MFKKETYYDILGVSLDASPEEIKKAYLRELEKHHPDKNPLNIFDAEERSKLIGEAFETLFDASKRRGYNKTIQFDPKTSFKNRKLSDEYGIIPPREENYGVNELYTIAEYFQKNKKDLANKPIEEVMTWYLKSLLKDAEYVPNKIYEDGTFNRGFTKLAKNAIIDNIFEPTYITSLVKEAIVELQPGDLEKLGKHIYGLKALSGEKKLNLEHEVLMKDIEAPALHHINQYLNVLTNYHQKLQEQESAAANTYTDAEKALYWRKGLMWMDDDSVNKHNENLENILSKKFKKFIDLGIKHQHKEMTEWYVDMIAYIPPLLDNYRLDEVEQTIKDKTKKQRPGRKKEFGHSILNYISAVKESGTDGEPGIVTRDISRSPLQLAQGTKNYE